MNAEELLIQAGLDKSVWGTLIIAAEQDRGFSGLDRKLSGQWTTCACGEHAKGVDLDLHGAPKDDQLRKLGSRFAHNVTYNSYNRAARILIDIEERVGQLLGEIK